jgi:small-conductance mechanosensitive channel
VFNKKIKELEKQLKREKELNEAYEKEISIDAQTKVHLTSDLENANNLVEQMKNELDILRKERKEIKEKLENNVDKDALITLLTMKNHELELKIIELNHRLGESYKMQNQIMSIQQYHPCMPGPIMYPNRYY